MKIDAIDLLDSYIEFRTKTTDYKVVNDIIKDYLKCRKTKMNIEDYLLELKYQDLSTFKPEAIDYLRNNKFNSFIKKSISNERLKKAVDEKKIDRIFVISNIDKETNYLDINIDFLEEDLCNRMGEIYNEYINKNIVEVIEKRFDLKNEIEKNKFEYYNKIKYVKSQLEKDYFKEPYKFKYNNKTGFLTIENKSITYKSDFIETLESMNINVIDYSVDSKKIISSKSKKLNRVYLESVKIPNYREMLYIKRAKSSYFG